jgi:uncharacterized phiE125 gp8 family phage protein
MRGLTVVTGPAVEPWTLDEVRGHLRVEHHDEDLLIEGLLRAAIERVELIAQRSLITQTLEARYDAFPGGRALTLPRPCQSVTSVQYTPAGAVVASTFAASNYQVDTVGTPGSIWLRSGCSWPGDELEPVNGVQVQFVAGYGDAATDVPQTLRQLLLMYVAHWYERPETDPSQGEILRALDNLVLAYRWE